MSQEEMVNALMDAYKILAKTASVLASEPGFKPYQFICDARYHVSKQIDEFTAEVFS
jgi:hypothetical protein